jgi:hypothetical protein
MASYSDWREVNKAGIEVWFAGLGGRVDGSNISVIITMVVYERTSNNINQVFLGQGLS